MKKAKITSVLVMDSETRGKLIKFRVCLSDEELQDFSNTVDDPSERSMIDYFDNQNIEDLSTSTKYYICGTEETQAYQLDILKELMTNLNDASELKSIEDIYDKDGKLLCNLVAYVSKEENGDEQLFLYTLEKTNLIKDKGFWIFKKKVGSSGNNAAKVEQVENGFNLPTNKCIASLYKRKDAKEGKQYKAKIYQAYSFDEVFNTKQTQYEYVDRTLKKFKKAANSIKLTQDEISVYFKKEDFENIKNVICEDDYLTKTFVSFHDTTRRTIKKIELNKLKDVINSLRDYVNNNADAGFVLENIPNINNNNDLEITDKSVPTFAALLDNKVIERLLNKKIEIPYFKRH